jgi:hypothetical protein
MNVFGARVLVTGAIVPVGIESSFSYRVLRFAPGPIQGLLARADMP